MTDKSVSPLNSPVSLVAQFDDVSIFQTRAFVAINNAEALATDNQQLQRQLQLGQTSYGEFNLGLHVNDDSRSVLSNRMQLLSAINEQLSELPLSKQPLDKQPTMIDSLYWVNQVHGKQIHDIDNGNNASKLTMQPIDADAMVSQQANVGLAIMTADCVPIVLYQPTTKQIAAIHAGWQGLAYGVIKATVERFASNEPIIAWIGACISQANYEVNRQVLEKLLVGCTENALLDLTTLNNFTALFSKLSVTDDEISSSNTLGNIPSNNLGNNLGSNIDNKINNADLHKSIDKLSNYATLSTDKVSIDKVKLNLPKLARAQLEHLAITVANQMAIDCSYQHPSYYSYRRQTHLQQPATGRMALVIVRNS